MAADPGVNALPFDAAKSGEAFVDSHDSSRLAAFVALAAVCVAYLMNAVDRQLLAVLQEPIAQELSLSDTELGSLSLFFAVAFALASFPIAALADRGWLRASIVGALATWSAFTAACGWAEGFIALAVARIGVAIGESGITPASQSLISHRFPARQRASAISVLVFSGILGAALAFGLGGYLATQLGWREAFWLLGATGVVLSPLVWAGISFRAPPTRAKQHGSQSTIWPVLNVFWKNKSVRYLTIGSAAVSFSGYGISQWMVSFLVRETGATVMEAAGMMLTFGITAAATGSLLGGIVSDFFGRRDDRAYALVPAVAMSLGLPAVALITLSGDASLLVIGFVIAQFIPTFCMAPAFAVVQRVAPENSRAIAAAAIALTLNLVGMGGGSFLIGVASDVLAYLGVQSPLRFALLLCAGAFAVGAVFAVVASRWILADLRKAES